MLFLYDFPDVSFIAQARWAVAGRCCSRPWINGMKEPLWAVILLPLVWDASSLPAKQMPVIYSVKNPQEEGDIVKTLLKSDVFNEIKRNKKIYIWDLFPLQSLSPNAALQAFHLSASTQLSIPLPTYKTLFLHVLQGYSQKYSSKGLCSNIHLFLLCFKDLTLFSHIEMPVLYSPVD